jgi:hypothetical protein
MRNILRFSRISPNSYPDRIVALPPGVIIVTTTTTTTTTTAIELSLGGNSPYTSTDKTNKNKYI